MTNKCPYAYSSEDLIDMLRQHGRMVVALSHEDVFRIMRDRGERILPRERMEIAQEILREANEKIQRLSEECLKSEASRLLDARQESLLAAHLTQEDQTPIRL